jgi:hypothetical protein
MNVVDYIHLAIAKEAQQLLSREPGETSHAFDRRVDKYIDRRMRGLADALIALERERSGRRAV